MRGMWNLTPRIYALMEAALACLTLVTGAAFAQAPSFPSKQVRIILGVPPGGVSDTLTRALGQELTKKWGQTVVVENRPGANGVIATSAVGKSAPDGSTILMTNSAQFITTPFLVASAPYDPVKEFTPVSALVRTDDVLVASPQSSAKTVQELITLARAKPGQLNYGSFGPGSATHLDAESFSAAAGIKATHIPYKGGPEVLKAVTTGEIDFAFTGLTPTIPLVQEGRVRGLAYGGARRSPVLPDVPTFAEAGLNGVITGAWFVWLVPVGTLPAVVDKIAADASDVLGQPEFSTRFVTGVGLEPLRLAPAATSALLKADLDAYTLLIKTLNIKLQ